VKSPCTKVCLMDLQTGLCRGCYRTLEEIGGWGAMSDAERDEVLRDLEKRKASDVAKVSVPPLP
jgi:predicted Fe-S protein YdhL (DUF1289 family)